MIKFFSICFLLLPWVMIPNDKLADPFRLPKATFFDFICMGLICFSFYTGLRKRYFNKYLSWLIIWLFVVIGINWYLPYTLSFNNRQVVNLWILEPMIHLILALWASYITLSYFEKDDYVRIAKVICLSSVLISSIGILQSLGLNIFGKIAWYSTANKFTAFLDNPDMAGAYIALSVPFFLLFKDKKYLFGLIIAIIGIILSKSAMAVICGGVGFLTYLLFMVKENKRIFYSLIFLSVLTIISTIFNFKLFLNEFAGRLQIWKMTWVHFKDNPIFGQGIGIFKTWNIIYLHRWDSVHNDWFERAIELGVVGVILIILVIFNSIKKFNYKSDNNIGFVYFVSFISFLVLMLGSFPLEIAPLALFGLTDWWAIETL